jgi:hypothetical protein
MNLKRCTYYLTFWHTETVVFVTLAEPKETTSNQERRTDQVNKKPGTVVDENTDSWERKESVSLSELLFSSVLLVTLCVLRTSA